MSHGDLEAFYLDHSEMWKRSLGDQRRVSLEKAELRQDQQMQEESQERADRHPRGEWRVAGMSVLLCTMLVSESLESKTHKRFKIILSIKPAAAQKRNFVCFTVYWALPRERKVTQCVPWGAGQCPPSLLHSCTSFLSLALISVPSGTRPAEGGVCVRVCTCVQCARALLRPSCNTVWDAGEEEVFLPHHCPPLWVPRRKMLSLLMWRGGQRSQLPADSLFGTSSWSMR